MESILDVVYNPKGTFKDLVLATAAYEWSFIPKDQLAQFKSENEPRVKRRIEYLEYAQQELEKAEAVTLTEAAAELSKMKKEAERSNAERKARADKMKSRYATLIQQTKQWQPPTPEHEELKQLMLKRLEYNQEFDCVYHEIDLAEFDILPAEHLANCIEEAREDVEKAKSYLAEETARAVRIYEWNKALHKSLEGLDTWSTSSKTEKN